MKTVLFIDHYVPEPDRDAGSRAVLSYMTALCKLGFRVVFRPYDGKAGSSANRHLLSDLGIDVITGEMPRFLWWYLSHARSIDLIIYSRPFVHRACHKFLSRMSSQPTVFFGHDLHFQRMREQATMTEDRVLLEQSISVEKLERRIWKISNLSVYPSQEEVDRVREMDESVNVTTVPLYCFDEFRVRAEPSSGKNVIFVAGFAHPPNIDAAKWLVEQIWPHIIARFPDARLSLIGSKPTQDVLNLASETVQVTGFVSETVLNEHYAKARVAVVPLRFGAGVKLKVVEAMQLGVPLVTTPVGAQGLEDLGTLVPISDDPVKLVDSICHLLTDNDLWMTQMTAQHHYVRERFSVDMLTSSIRQSFADFDLPLP